MSRKHALGWGRFTNSRLQVHIREGAHFAVVDDMAFIHDVINRELQEPGLHRRAERAGLVAWFGGMTQSEQITQLVVDPAAYLYTI